VIAATVDEHGAIVHLNRAHSVTFGERDGTLSQRCRRIAEQMGNAGFDSRLSDSIVQDMWEKWVFLSTLAATTCTMRASIGDILAAPAGQELITRFYDECREIAAANGFEPRAPSSEQALKMLTQPASELTASMLRDIERNAKIEADHIIGDLLARRTPALQPNRLSLLEVALVHLKAYEARQRGRGSTA
jgi:2-dehydropantoate 2-reductase